MKSRNRVSASVGRGLVLSATMLLPMLAQAGGSLTPPGPPGVTMKSLQEIQPRTIISGPTTITAPGSYYLSNNITVTTGDGIDISASGVTLDLNGFTISSTAGSPTGYGVYVTGSYNNITIVNGSILGTVADNGSGTFTGAGFSSGIYASGATDVHVANVNVYGVLNYGIYLGYQSVVDSCAVNSVGFYGILGGTVRGCTAFYCCGTGGGTCISGVTVSDCVGGSSWAGEGIYAYNANNSYGFSGTSYGLYAGIAANNCYGGTSSGAYGLYTGQANNSYGSSGSTNTYGLYAANATECYGNGGYAGVYAYDTAIGCYGTSGYGYGISATAAENCYGYTGAASSSGSWAGIYAESVNNSYGSSYYWPGIRASAVNNSAGESTYGYGIDGYDTSYAINGSGCVVQNSYGYSYYSFGLTAYSAINCYGFSQTGVGVACTEAENCYALAAASGGEGLSCTVANNCYGYIGGTSGAAWGIDASVVNNCYGDCESTGGSGRGIIATVVNNSYGYCGSSPSGSGVYASEVAMGSVGFAYGASSTGLISYIGNSCVGNTEAVTLKYNMP